MTGYPDEPATGMPVARDADTIAAVIGRIGTPDLPLTLEEWGQWMSGELVAREIVAPTKEEAKRESKRQRRLNYLRANKKEKARNDKRGIKWRDKRWRRKRERWDASKGENAHEQTE